MKLRIQDRTNWSPAILTALGAVGVFLALLTVSIISHLLFSEKGQTVGALVALVAQLSIASIAISFFVMGLNAYKAQLKEDLEAEASKASLMALRRQKHEFANTLQTIAGMIEIKREQQALKLAVDSLHTHSAKDTDLIRIIGVALTSELQLSVRPVQIRLEMDLPSDLSLSASITAHLVRVLNLVAHEAVDAAQGVEGPAIHVITRLDGRDLNITLHYPETRRGATKPQEILDQVGGEILFSSKDGMTTCQITLPDLIESQTS